MVIVEPLIEANRLMVAALALLDAEHHPAAARLDHAIVELGLRPPLRGCRNSGVRWGGIGHAESIGVDGRL